jgi:hypothetical protein
MITFILIILLSSGSVILGICSSGHCACKQDKLPHDLDNLTHFSKPRYGAFGNSDELTIEVDKLLNGDTNNTIYG